jgi:molecular chaperone DnaK (HSP70)
MADQETNQKTIETEEAPSTGRLASSVGMGLPNGQFKIFLPKGSLVPCEQSTRLLSRLKEYNKVNIQVFSGESDQSEDNIFLGEVGLENIRLNKDGQALLDVIFSVDTQNLLHVYVKDEPGKKASNATFRLFTEGENIAPGIPGSKKSQDAIGREQLLKKLTMLEKKIDMMEKELEARKKE